MQEQRKQNTHLSLIKKNIEELRELLREEHDFNNWNQNNKKIAEQLFEIFEGIYILSAVETGERKRRAIRLRAAGVVRGIMILSKRLLKELVEEVEELKKLDENESDEVWFVINCVFLYHAVEFFSENIKEKSTARRFEKYLYYYFKFFWQRDFALYINHLVARIETKGETATLDHIGYKICEIIGVECLVLTTEINIHCISFWPKLFNLLRKMWICPEEKISRLLMEFGRDLLVSFANRLHNTAAK